MRFSNFLLAIFAISSIYSCSCASSISSEQNEEETSVQPNSENKIPENEDSVISNKDKKLNLNDLCEDSIIIIGSYFYNPVAAMGFINKKFYDMFHAKYSLKYYTLKSFKIPEFESVSDTEPELHNMLGLARCRNDNFLLVGSLLEDISSGKKSFKSLVPSLISFLERALNDLSDDQKNELEIVIMKRFGFLFKGQLGQICAHSGHYELAATLLSFIPNNLTKMLSEIEDREGVFKFLKEKPDFALNIKRSWPLQLLEVTDNVDRVKYLRYKYLFKWIAECIIYEAPEEFYAEFLAINPILFKYLDKYLLHSANIPESKYHHIHAQIVRLLNLYLKSRGREKLFNLLSLANDIRFGPFELQEFDFSNFDADNLAFISISALLGDKKDLFLQIFNFLKARNYLVLDNIPTIENLSGNSLQAKCFKVVFELIAGSTTKIFRNEYFYLEFIPKFYAINRIRLESNQLYFEFVALDNLLALEFPPSVNFSLAYRNINYFIDRIFLKMQVFDENTLLSFLDFYENRSIYKLNQEISSELAAFISKSPILMEKIKKLGIEFKAEADKKMTYFDKQNFEGANQVIKDLTPFSEDLPLLKSKKYFGIIERNEGTTFADKFLTREWIVLYQEHREMTKSEYFQWRLIFDHWINSDQKEKIREIKSSAIIEMLRLEYPEEMVELLGPESAST